MDERTVIRRVQDGDTEAYALLVREHHRDLLACIHRLVRDPHLTEDIGQEVFLDAYKALKRFDPERGTPFIAWLRVLARNRCVSALRARGRAGLSSSEDTPEPACEGPGPEGALMGLEERQVLAASIDKLEEPFRSTLLMSLSGDPLEDIAGTCGVPTATVKTRLYRAREKLRRLLAASFGGGRYERQL
jgi:RNA polymerase sigma-70 factor (ECF subfamily)